jgi:phosphopentomutase
MRRRALLIVLDSVGVGGAPDAAAYGDEGADTLGHLHRQAGLHLPVLWRLGLARILGLGGPEPEAAHGRMRERSAGKDSTTGHWEIAGVVLDRPFAVYERIPEALVGAIEAEAGLRFLGNLAASGTQIIDDLGAEHLRTGRPILYTSADSVLQIAAHEAVLPVDRLYALCEVARRHADAYRIGRVIARPFLGEPGAFRRTPRRHDFSMRPPPTVLDAIASAGLPVKGVGKVGDLFAGQGLTESHPTGCNEEGMRRTEAVWRETDRGLVFTNLVDFDTEHGHRRDAPGYARALLEFDTWLGAFLPECGPEDLLIVTADHGNDPTFRGTDHTREEVPLILRHRGRRDPLGTRESFADVAATLADHFGLPSWPIGTSCLA